jgi:GNAT superfamily N-acetyltransferase
MFAADTQEKPASVFLSPGQCNHADMNVRNAQITDATVIAHLLTQLGYPSTGQDVRDRLTYWTPDQASRVLVGELDGRVVGCLSMHAVPYLERTGRWARVESLVVEQSVRGTGIGRGLLRAAEALARDWGCLAVEITSARTRHDAHAFYQHMGYADVCDRAGRFWKAFP